jgi:alpha-amylase
MSTKNAGIGMDRGIYDSPYDTFTNYMNILGDFLRRIAALYPADLDSEELNSLVTTIRNQNIEIEELKAKLESNVLASEEQKPKQPLKKKTAPKKS